MRLDLLLSCLVGGVIGLGIPRRVIGWIKRECGIEGAPRHDEAETAAKQEGDAEDTSEVTRESHPTASPSRSRTFPRA